MKINLSVNKFLYFTQYKRKINFFYYILDKAFVKLFGIILVINYIMNLNYSIIVIMSLVGVYAFYSYAQKNTIIKYYEINKHWIVKYIEGLRNEV